MITFRFILAVMLIVLSIYTFNVFASDGFNLASVFFGDILNGGWSGQFNLDFLMLLLLSGFWVAWRHQFSTLGIVIGLIASVGGVLFLSAYLLVVSFQANGNANRILLGHRWTDPDKPV